MFGAFWDGSDLYSIAPASAVEPFLDASLPEAARAATFVYRLADTQGGVDHDFCGMSSEGAPRGAALNQYRALMAELKSIAASSVLPLQIELALVGDPELAGRFTDPQGQMLAVVNIVDGLFANQLGVSILPTDVRVLEASGNPLQSTDAPTLLQQLSGYRVATPAVRERGLAHLLTGKELDGSVAGIAFFGALCETAAGVGLSEGWHSSSIAALIMAHELGHN
ncbi:MAG: zinc-dependent metalloprotease family protein, partial [Steroidobacteraceae bacterium]